MNLLKKLKKYTLYRKYKRDFWSFFFKKKKKDIASYAFLKTFSTQLQKVTMRFLKKLIFKLKRPVFTKNSIFFTKIFYFKKFLKSSALKVLNTVKEYGRFEWFSRYTWYIHYQMESLLKFTKFTKRFKGQKSKYNHLRYYLAIKEDFSYHPNFFRIKPFMPRKKPLAYWLKRRKVESFTSLFYGYTSLKKFKKAQDSFFFKTRSSNVGLFFENSIYIFLFRVNIFREHYAIKNIVEKGFIQVNKTTVLNVFFKFKLNDDISVNKRYFRKIYFMSRKNVRKLINFPNYIIFNPIILCGSIWRNPFKHEICGFYDFNIGRNFFGKLSSTSFYAK